MHVARTVIAERGPACACRQRMAVSFPSLASCHRWLLERGKAEAGLCALLYFEVVCTTNFFYQGLENQCVRVDKFLKMAPFIHSKRASSKNLDYFQEKLIHCFSFNFQKQLGQMNIEVGLCILAHRWSGKGGM